MVATSTTITMMIVTMIDGENYSSDLKATICMYQSCVKADDGDDVIDKHNGSDNTFCTKRCRLHAMSIVVSHVKSYVHDHKGLCCILRGMQTAHSCRTHART